MASLFAIGLVILCFKVLFRCSLVVSISAIDYLQRLDRPRNDLLCVEWDVIS